MKHKKDVMRCAVVICVKLVCSNFKNKHQLSCKCYVILLGHSLVDMFKSQIKVLYKYWSCLCLDSTRMFLIT